MTDAELAQEIRDKKRKREREKEDIERRRKQSDWLNPSNLADPANPLSWVVFY